MVEQETELERTETFQGNQVNQLNELFSGALTNLGAVVVAAAAAPNNTHTNDFRSYFGKKKIYLFIRMCVCVCVCIYSVSLNVGNMTNYQLRVKHCSTSSLPIEYYEHIGGGQREGESERVREREKGKKERKGKRESWRY